MLDRCCFCTQAFVTTYSRFPTSPNEPLPADGDGPEASRNATDTQRTAAVIEIHGKNLVFILTTIRESFESCNCPLEPGFAVQSNAEERMRHTLLTATPCSPLLPSMVLFCFLTSHQLQSHNVISLALKHPAACMHA